LLARSLGLLRERHMAESKLARIVHRTPRSSRIERSSFQCSVVGSSQSPGDPAQADTPGVLPPTGLSALLRQPVAIPTRTRAETSPPSHAGADSSSSQRTAVGDAARTVAGARPDTFAVPSCRSAHDRPLRPAGGNPAWRISPAPPVSASRHRRPVRR
jgi:hypothetical protein